MTYDQSQSPRFGQPTPVEQPGIQVRSSADLPEVAFTGQMIYQADKGIIGVYDGSAWQDTSSSAGARTFVDDVEPTADNIGDLWLNSVTYELKVWDGTSWQQLIDPDNAALQAAVDSAQAAADAAQAAADTAIANAADAQASADGKVTTFFATSAPTAEGVGDLWFDTDDGYHLYRWDGSTWVDAQDAAISLAAAAADTAQNTADGKIQTFYQTSAPTAVATGDLWVDTDDNNRLYRWNGSSWVDVRDGTIAVAQSAADAANAAAVAAAAAAEAAQNDADTAIANAADAQATADGKVTSFFATSAPTAEGVGDLWFDTDDGNKVYRWNGSSWVVAQDQSIATAAAAAATAQSTADGKIQTFYQTSEPVGVSIGDLWVDTDDNNKLYRWNGTSWVSIRDTTIAQAASAANDAYTAALAAQSAADAAQATADGAITTYYVSTAPWANGSSGHDNNAGDMWFDTDDGQAYRWNASTKNWDVIEDNSIAAALAAANTAQATADGKITAFYQTTAPTSGMHTDDLWYDTDDGNKPYYYNGSSWVSVRDGTIATAQSTADSKNKIYYQTSAPSSGMTAGDLWFDSDDGNKPYRYNGSTWVTVQDGSIATAQSTATAAQTTANGKNTVYYSTSAPGTTANVAGDIWFQTSGGNIIAQYKGNGGTSWTSVQITSTVIANLDAGKITSGTLSAITISGVTISGTTITGGSITGTTITGGTIQTGTNGQRFVLSGSVLQFYSGAGTETAGFLDPLVYPGTTKPRVQLQSPYNTTYAAKSTLSLGAGDGVGGASSYLQSGSTYIQLNSVTGIYTNSNGYTVELDNFSMFYVYGPMTISGAINMSGYNVTNAGNVTANGGITCDNSGAGGGFSDGSYVGAGTTSANINNNGRVVRASTKEIKEAIEPMTMAEAKSVLGLKSYTFRYKKDEHDLVADPRRYPGFIAEQGAEAGAELWVARQHDVERDPETGKAKKIKRNKQGKPVAFRTADITVAHNMLIKELTEKVESLENTVSSLLARVEALEAR